MVCVIDCGTTNSRIYILDDRRQIVASGSRKVGVRDTAISGSADTLRGGLAQLFFQVLEEHGISPEAVDFALASGMITSEIGLKEVPHLTAPASKTDLARGVVRVEDDGVLPIGIPILLIPGIKNDRGPDATIQALRQTDFMRGEEVQCVGVAGELAGRLPVNLLVLSSHTKLIHIDREGAVQGSVTTLSGQLYEALTKETFLSKSVLPLEGDGPSGYSEEEIIRLAREITLHGGLVRALMMPRFMHVLYTTTARERQLFLNAAIAVDDLRILDEYDALGYRSETFVLFGQRERAALYRRLLAEKYGDGLAVEVFADQELARLTVAGVMDVFDEYIKLS